MMVHNLIRSIYTFREPQSQVVRANLELGCSFIACTWIRNAETVRLCIEEIGIVAVSLWAFRRRIKHIWGTDRAVGTPSYMAIRS